MMTLDRVTVRYGDAAALDGLSLTVPDGQWLGLVGPNGAGKSTALRAMARLVRHSGTVTVRGRDTGRLAHRELARLVAYVPQQPELPAGMTALGYTLLGRTPHIGYFGTESADDIALCATLLERLGVSQLAARGLRTLSGGEVQRVVLARALAQQAPLLLLDEPTSALDIGNRVEALELVDELRRERDLTVVAVMHDLTLAAQFADRLALLVHGRLAAFGPPADVLDEGLLTLSFGGRVRVLHDESGAPIVLPVRAARLAAGGPRPGAAPAGHTQPPETMPSATGAIAAGGPR